MNTPDDGGPMFPQSNATTYGDEQNPAVHEGASLRSWLAGMALCGWAAGRNNSGETMGSRHEQVAKACVAYADAVIKELGV